MNGKNVFRRILFVKDLYAVMKIKRTVFWENEGSRLLWQAGHRGTTMRILNPIFQIGIQIACWENSQTLYVFAS